MDIGCIYDLKLSFGHAEQVEPWQPSGLQITAAVVFIGVTGLPNVGVLPVRLLLVGRGDSKPRVILNWTGPQMPPVARVQLRYPGAFWLSASDTLSARVEVRLSGRLIGPAA